VFLVGYQNVYQHANQFIISTIYYLFEKVVKSGAIFLKNPLLPPRRYSPPFTTINRYSPPLIAINRPFTAIYLHISKKITTFARFFKVYHTPSNLWAN
jgi:hypothetical protein